MGFSWLSRNQYRAAGNGVYMREGYRSALWITAVVSVLLGMTSAASSQVVRQYDSMIDAPDSVFEERLIRKFILRQEQTGGRVISVAYRHFSRRTTSGSGGFRTAYRTWSGQIVVDPEVGLDPELVNRYVLPELEPIQEEAPPEDEVVGEYRMIDYARDLIAGRYSAQLEGVADSLRDGGGGELPRMSRKQIVEEAVGAYGTHLAEFPEDWMAMREMAVALLEFGRVQDAQDLMAVAYLQDPELGIYPVPRLIYGEGFMSAMDTLIQRAVRHAHGEPSADGWLLVAVLMQADGRAEVARKMIDRAAELGLEESILEGFRSALP